MSGVDTASEDGLLKDVFEDFIAEAVNQKNPLKDLFKTQTISAGGRQHIYTSHVSRNASPMFVHEGGAFAEATSQGHVQLTVDQRKAMGRILMTYESMVDSRSSEFAYKSSKKDEMDGLIKDLARKQEYALVSEGRGVLAKLSGDPGTDSDEVELKDPGNIVNSNFGNRFVQPGQFVGAVNPATGALRSGIVKVSSVNSDGTGFTPDGNINTAWADGDYLVQAANASVTDVLDTSYEAAWWGLMALVDDGTYRDNYFGVLRSVRAAYASYVKASTGAFSMDLAQQVSDVVNQKLGGAIDLILAHHSTRRLVLNVQDADRRYTGDALFRPDIGTAAMKQEDIPIGSIPIKVIRDFPLDVMMFLDKANSGWVEYVSEAGKWVDEDGSILVRVGSGNSGRDQFEGWYRIRKQFHCRYPGYNARLDGITGQSLVIVRAE